VFALGDIALMTADESFPQGHPQLAQVAIQQAANLARNLNAGRFEYKFRYNDKGSMATVGRNRAVVDLNHMRFGGFFAWLVWMFIHLISILGMRNKVAVLVNWLWAYFTYGTSLRLIMHPNRYPMRERWGERRV
ncbi:MAG: NAD(P)/FAD-dependent oxidoreductase, partial [Muribaculaceae bacterium]|nr:NAD(P)/FAD-dependent oxidoreductase [Muribaculaceae bacterium]